MVTQNEEKKRRPQDDLPYERRMLYIIKDYRKLVAANEMLDTYAKQLEEANEELRDENDKLSRENENLIKVKSPNEHTINTLTSLVKEKRDIILSQRSQISLLQRELAEYKKLYGEL